MKQIANDIMNITSGVIVHQVNCQNRIGAGIFGVIIKKYPSVEKAYHWIFTQMTKLHNFPMKIQKKSGKIYTDTDALIHALTVICERYPDKEIYIPEKIGCEFGGADWNKLLLKLKPLRVTIVSQINTNHAHKGDGITMLYRKNATIKDLINSEKLKMITIRDITTDTVLHTGAVANIPMAILTIPFIYDTLVSHRNKDAQVYVRINQPRRTTNYYKKRYR